VNNAELKTWLEAMAKTGRLLILDRAQAQGLSASLLASRSGVDPGRLQKFFSEVETRLLGKEYHRLISALRITPVEWIEATLKASGNQDVHFHFEENGTDPILNYLRVLNRFYVWASGGYFDADASGPNVVEQGHWCAPDHSREEATASKRTKNAG
jgi:hypothetical protein